MMDEGCTREQVRAVDTHAIEVLGIPGLVLMENAGRQAAERIRLHLAQTSADRVVVFCGTGNNGGDGFVVARHLANWGVRTEVYLAGDAGRLSPDAAVNHRIVRSMGLPVRTISNEAHAQQAAAALEPTDLVVDALLGTGFQGAVRPPMDALIRAINQAHHGLTVALDVPSGLDCNTGSVANIAVQADLTITFVAPKVGFKAPSALSYVGQVTVCDIGAPPDLIHRVPPKA